MNMTNKKSEKGKKILRFISSKKIVTLNQEGTENKRFFFFLHLLYGKSLLIKNERE